VALEVSPGVRFWVRTLIALVVFIVLIGATYQGVATSFERHRFLRPGGLVEGDGYQLHIYCVGQGSPTVILEAAAGSMSPAWALVQPDIGRITRVCSYDRSGLGWSEGDGRYLPDRVPDNLRTLLAQANEHGPFVLVGHELGAAFARLYAARDPVSTVALVLIDDPVEGRLATRTTANVVCWPWLARIGVLRATGRLDARAEGLPGDAGGAMRAFLNRPDHLTQAAREIARSTEVVSAAAAATVDSSVIVTSVTSTSHEVPAVLVASADVALVKKAIETTVIKVRSERPEALEKP
jgi:pimeloyl-ACP methyl ester carboxylesterase